MSKKLKIILIIFGIIFFLSLIVALMEGPFSPGKVGLVNIKGIIVESKSTIEEIRRYRKDPTIRAIVIRVDSPGGAVVPSQEIYEEIKRTIKSKPVVVSMGSIATSGAYYISSPATKIVANPGTLTGSIGVLIEIPNIKGLLDKVGVKTEVIKSAKYKDITSPFKSLQSDEREILQTVIDDVHEQFIKAVSEGRKIPIEKVRKIADGRVFTGLKAKDLGLIDETGDLNHAIKVAAELAKIKGEPEVVTKKTPPFIELLKTDAESLLKKLIPYLQIHYLFHPTVEK